MEVDQKSQDGNPLEIEITEASESSPLDDSAEASPYYPNLDFSASTKKVRSRLGKRRTTMNAFRISSYLNETNDSNNSAENSHSMASCPSFFGNTDIGVKNISTSVQENCPVPPSGQNVEHQKVKNDTFKPKAFFQDKSSVVDTDKIDHIGDNPYVPKTEQKTNLFSNTNASQTYKTPLKQMTDNIFTGSTTKVNYNQVHQSNSAKNLFGPKIITDTKENALNSSDGLRTNKKVRGVFSSSVQNEKNSASALKKFESPKHLRGKESETQSPYKGPSKAASLDDTPLDLKLKLKTEKMSNKQTRSSSNERPKNKSSEVRKESEETPRPKLNCAIDSNFINIFQLPSVRRTEESPARPIYSSFSTPALNSNFVMNEFKEPAAPIAKRQPIDTSPRESTVSEGYSLLNLSVNSDMKTSFLESKNSQVNQLNTTDINTASFIPNSNSSFLVDVENASKRGNRTNSSCLSSGSDGNSSSVSHSSSARNTLFELPKTDETDGASQSRISSNPNPAPNVSMPSTFHRNSNAVSVPSNKSVFSGFPLSESRNDAQTKDCVFNPEKRFPEKESIIGKSTNVTVMRSDKNIKPKERNVPSVFPTTNLNTKALGNHNMEVQKNIFESTNNDSERFNVAKTKPVSEPNLLASEVFKKLPTQVLPVKTAAPDLFKKPTQPPVLNIGGSGIPVAVSQPTNINPNPVLLKLDPPASKPYSFASEVAKLCQKEGGAKLNSIKQSEASPASNNIPMIKVNNRSYQILSTLGKGGSSEVYQVLDPSNKSLLAVKVVKLAAVDECIAEGYMNEVALLEKLQGCVNVIRMFDYEHIQGSKKLYVVMEKGDTDLSRLLKDINKTKKISMSMIIYYWTEMLTAVQEIHEKGIIHSDLKPANFLLVSGRLKLIDFGIASSLQGDMTSVHKDICAGTENYMSPEAIQDGTSTNDKKFKISYKSDVWSLGCILYNLIYGKTPFSHITNRWGKMYAIISSSHKIDFPDRPMPPVLRQALQSCLIRDPKQRPTVKELLNLPYHTPSLSKDLPVKIQQILPEEWWQKIAHLFSEPGKSNPSQGK